MLWTFDPFPSTVRRFPIQFHWLKPSATCFSNSLYYNKCYQWVSTIFYVTIQWVYFSWAYIHEWRKIYVPIYLWLYSPSGPWLLFHFLNLYTVGRIPWMGDQPISSLLPTHRVNTHRCPYLKWDSNPQSQCWSGWRQFMPYSARSPWSAWRKIL
jgi:hypothetical protein